MELEDNVKDIKEATKQAMAEIKAEQLAEKEAKTSKELDIKELVKAAMAEVKEVEQVEVVRVKSTITKDVKYEVKSNNSFYNRKNYKNLIGYKDSEVDEAYDDGMFWAAQFFSDEIAKEYCVNHGIEVKTLTSTNNAAVIPEQLVNRIIILADEHGVIRRNSTIWPATTSTMDLPKNDADTVSSYTLEGIEKELSTATTQLVSTPIVKLTVASLLNMELIQDSIIDMISYVVENMARELARKTDSDALLGNGTIQSGNIDGIIPILQAAGGEVVVNPISNLGTWESIVAADFDALEAAISEDAWRAGDVKYYMSNGFKHKVINRIKREGGSSVVEMENGKLDKLNGIPIETTSILPTADRQNPSDVEVYCILGSVKTCSVLAERMGRTVSITSEGKALTLANQTLIVSELRWGFTVHDTTGSMVLLQGKATG